MAILFDAFLKLEDQGIQKKYLKLQEERDKMLDRHFSKKLKTEVSEAEKQRTFLSRESSLSRGFQSSEAQSARDWSSAENKLNRLLTASEGQAGRDVQERAISSRENIAGAQQSLDEARLDETKRQFDLGFDVEKTYRNALVNMHNAATEAQNLSNLYNARKDVQDFKTSILNNQALLSEQQTRSAKRAADLADLQHARLAELMYSDDPAERSIATGFFSNNAEAQLLRQENEQGSIQLEMLGRTNALLQTMLGVETQKSRDAMTALSVASNPSIVDYMTARMKNPELYHKSVFGDIADYIGLPSGIEYQSPGGLFKAPGTPEPVDVTPSEGLEDVTNALRRSLGME